MNSLLKLQCWSFFSIRVVYYLWLFDVFLLRLCFAHHVLSRFILIFIRLITSESYHYFIFCSHFCHNCIVIVMSTRSIVCSRSMKGSLKKSKAERLAQERGVGLLATSLP